MRRLMMCLVCVFCASFGSRVLAQDNLYGDLALEFVRVYTQDPSNVDLPLPTAPDFYTETVLCSETPPTEFEALVLDEDYPGFPVVDMVGRVGTNQGDLYVVFTSDDTSESGVAVQSVVCGNSPAGQAIKLLASNGLHCWQETPPYTKIEGHWTNRDGDRALIRLRTEAWKASVFIYVNKEGETWTYDKGFCSNRGEGQALSLLTDYMYAYQDFYFLGSEDKPTFAEVASVREGANGEQTTIQIQLETLSEYKNIQDDPLCMFNLRGYVIYEMRCTSN